MGSSQTVLPLKLAATDESLTAHGGLALFGEYLRAMGDWLRRIGAQGLGSSECEINGLAGMGRVNRSVIRRLLRQDDRASYTLDIDATQIVAEKREAHYTYKGEKGYMRDPRALCMDHAGRGRCSRNVVTRGDYAFDVVLFRAGPGPSPAQPCSKREGRPATAAEIAARRLGEAQNRRHRNQNGLKIDIQLLTPA